MPGRIFALNILLTLILKTRWTHSPNLKRTFITCIIEQTAPRHFIFWMDVIRVGSSFLKLSSILVVRPTASECPRPVWNCSALCLPYIPYMPYSSWVKWCQNIAPKTPPTILRPRWTITQTDKHVIALLTFTKYPISNRPNQAPSKPTRLHACMHACHGGRSQLVHILMQCVCLITITRSMVCLYDQIKIMGCDEHCLMDKNIVL
jgi:hypothetical protein